VDCNWAEAKIWHLSRILWPRCSRRAARRFAAGSADLAGKRKMIAALERLKSLHEPSTLPQNMTAFGIAGGVAQLFATHPPLEQRIARLQQSAG